MSNGPSADIALIVRHAREAKNWSQDELARRAGVSQTTIDKIERGETKRSRFLDEIGAALGVSLIALRKVAGQPGLETRTSWVRETQVLEGTKDTRRRPFVESGRGANPNEVALYASVEGGPGTMIVSNEPIDYIRRPEPLYKVSDGYAVLIVGESMHPEFEPGDYALVNPRLPPSPDSSCIFFTDDPTNDMATIKRLRRASTDEWFVSQWNPRDDFSLSREEWPSASRVVGKYSRR